MRIIYIHQHFRTPAMSGGTRSFEFARRLVERGHSVDMITARSEPASGHSRDMVGWEVTDEAGITVHWYRVPYANAMGFRDRVSAFIRFAIHATLRATRLPQDLVFATSTPLTVALPAVISKLRHRVNLVFEVRDVWPELPIALGVLRNPVLRLFALHLEAWAYRHSIAIITLSPDMAGGLFSRYPGLDITVIPNGSDTDMFGGVAESEIADFRTRTWLGDLPLVVYAGSLGVANNLGYVVELAEQMLSVDAEVRFLIVGEGKERGGIAALARQRGVLNVNLFMEEAVAKNHIPILLSAADLAISSLAPIQELYASSPNKVFDAFAAGLPVIINYDGWLRNVLEESDAGVAVPADDPKAGALMIAERIRDDNWLRTARLACRRLADERFNRQIQFEQFEQVLLRAAAMGKPR